jgi:uncharacterized protein YdhG (YjbR/CyaY superfamily)
MNEPSDVEEYLDSLPAEARPGVEQLRKAIRSVAPHASETISYRMPTFRDGDRILVYYAGFEDHESLFPASKAVLKTFAKDVEPYVSGKATLRFDHGRPVPVALVKKIVTARLEENRARRRRR